MHVSFFTVRLIIPPDLVGAPFVRRSFLVPADPPVVEGRVRPAGTIGTEAALRLVWPSRQPSPSSQCRHRVADHLPWHRHWRCTAYWRILVSKCAAWPSGGQLVQLAAQATYRAPAGARLTINLVLR